MQRELGQAGFVVARGLSLVTRNGRIEASPSPDARAFVSLPTRADQPFAVRDTEQGLGIEARLVGAREVAAEVVGDVVVYPSAHASGADVIHRITESGTEDYLLLDGPADVVYEVELGAEVAAVRKVGAAVEFLDETGDPRLRMDPPIITDAQGVAHEAVATVSGCHVDTDPRAPWGRSHPAPDSPTCTIAISWAALSYPALLDPAWNATGDMMQDRYGHGLVTLPSGLVMAIGGSRTSGGSGMALTTCETFNPNSGTWASAVSLPSFAFTVSCYLVSSNTKLFCWNGTDTSWMYNIATPSWTATGLMGVASRQAAANAQLADGRILFVSGGNPSTVTAEIFDPAGNGGLGTYAPTAFPPARGRSGGAAVLLADNRVLVAGGWNPTDMYMLQTEIFNPATGGFIPGPNMNVGTSNGTHGVRLPSNKVLIHGGFGVTQIFDAANGGSFVTGEAVPNASSSPGLLGFVGADVLMSIQATRTYLFDTAMNKWTESIAQTPRSATGASNRYGSHARIAGGRMLLVGGVDTTAERASMKKSEIFNLALAALGASCTVNAECTTNFCANGVCCSSACNAGCEVCSAAGACGTAPAGHSSAACGDYLCQGAASCPTTCSNDSQCVATDYCASDNTCKARHSQGTMCSTTDCKEGGCRFCASAGGCVDGYCCNDACNGACDDCAVNFGVCTNVSGGGMPSCGTYVCSGTASSCPTSCTSNAQCATTAFCNASSQCEAKRPAGQMCSASSNCQSGLTCVDSVCCTSTCGGQCQSCNRPGNLGSCVTVTGDPIGRTACNGSSSPCAGSCNGVSTSCVYPTVSCRAASCTGGTETLAASCNGSGACPAPTTNVCSPFACNDPMTACETTCTSNADCASTYHCEGTTCVSDTGTPTDAGVPTDASAPTDASVETDPDSGEPSDSGMDGDVDADNPDPRSRPSNAMCASSPAPSQGTSSATLVLGLACVVAVARRRRHVATLIAFFAVASTYGVAHAQVGENREAVARLHFQLGSALYEEGRFEQAAHEFELAYEASQRPQLLSNIYVAYRDAQMLEPALDALRRYTAQAPESETALLRSRLASLEAQVAEIQRLRAIEAPTEPTAEEPPPSPDATTEEASPTGIPEESDSGGGRGRRIVGVALIGLGGAGIATFVGSLIGVKSVDGVLNRYCGASVGLPEDECQNVPAVESAESRSRTFRTLGWTSLGVGVAATAVGTTLLLLGGDEDDTATASFACDQTGCIGVVRGSF